jgi:hypothetical protein
VSARALQRFLNTPTRRNFGNQLGEIVESRIYLQEGAEVQADYLRQTFRLASEDRDRLGIA